MTARRRSRHCWPAQRWDCCLLAAGEFAKAPTLLPTAGRLLLAGVVAAAGTHCEPAIAAGAGVHVDGAVSSDSLRSARLITNCVLVADIVRHGAADGIDFIRRFGQEGDSSGTLRRSE